MSPSPEPLTPPEHSDTTSHDPVPSTDQPPDDAASPSPADPPTNDDTPERDNANEHGSETTVDHHQPPTDAAESPKDAWQAVFSPDANAWYFWNAQTGETTWTNPRDTPAASAEAGPSSSSSAAPPDAGAAAPSAPNANAKAADPNALPEIDPDLAWLDPALAARRAGGTSLAQTGRFNARTGRFMADPSLNPDRISQFQRGQRQQEAYYDVQGWEQQLAGRGLKRAGAGEPAQDDAEGAKRRPSAKQVDKFRQQKEEKKRKKLTSWLT